MSARKVDEATIARVMADYSPEEIANGWALLMAREVENDRAMGLAMDEGTLNDRAAIHREYLALQEEIREHKSFQREVFP